MPLLVKEIIAPGDYHTDDGIVRATPQRIRHWLKQFKRMKAKGLPIPVPWEHQEGAKPLSHNDRLAQQATHNAGFWRGAFIDRDGRLWGKLDIPNEDDARHIERSVRYVSPEIDDHWVDGDGQVWKDIITHVALTPRPVHYKQKPFGAKPRLSSGRGAVQLSMANKVNRTVEFLWSKCDSFLDKALAEMRQRKLRRLSGHIRSHRLHRAVGITAERGRQCAEEIARICHLI